jgi:tryptophan 2,3-dioxygenase
MFVNAPGLQNALNAANLVELVAVQRAYGRERLPSAFREDWTRHHELAATVLNTPDCGAMIRQMASLLHDATYFIGTVTADGRPDYYQYADLRIVDWYVRATTDVEGLTQRCLDGVHALCDDIRRFEAASLPVESQGHDDEVNTARLEHRIQLAARICGEIVACGGNEFTEYVPYERVEAYVRSADARAALVHLTASPLTTSHDEFMFIRVLQVSELCFFALRVTIAAAIEAMKSGQWARATGDVESADVFAQLLCRVLRMLGTMPVAHFAQFRYSTGAASAIQSVNFQLLDVLLHGVNRHKVEHLHRFDHLRAVVQIGHERFMSLREAVRTVDTTTADGVCLLEACQHLDRSLLTWRGLHLSFARAYIPDHGPGTGGTSGAAYLRERLFHGVFENNEPDWQFIHEASREIEAFSADRLRPGVAIVP